MCDLDTCLDEKEGYLELNIQIDTIYYYNWSVLSVYYGSSSNDLGLYQMRALN